MPDIRSIPLSQLEISPLNARKMRTKEAIEAMAASLMAHGQLQTIVAHPLDDNRLGVAIGGTRLEAFQLLAKQKKIPSDHPITVDVRPANDVALSEQSLAENFMRTRMSPIDEFTAFAALIDEGHGPAEVGARFGQTARYVQQRMRLASVSQKLISIYRKGEMSLDQLEAFTIEADTRKQEKAWKALADWQRHRGDGEAIRAALTEQHVEIDSPFAKFVGLENYRAAGGSMTADLFDENPDAGYITDTALLDRLVGEKLAAEVTKLGAEEWKWAEAIPVLTWEEAEKYQRLRAKSADPTPEAREEIERLEAESLEIQETHGEQPEDEAVANRLDEISERYNELSEGEPVWTAEQKAVAGVIVTINRNGELEIRRGMVKPEDKAAARKLDGSAEHGGHEKPAKPKGGLPASLVAELTAHKTVAAQLVLADNAPVALLAVTHALALRMLYNGYSDEHTSLEIKAHGPTYPLAVREQIDKSATGKKLAAVVKGWKAKLPKKPELLWEWMQKQRPATIQNLLAVCAALTVDIVQSNGAEATPSSVALTSAIKLNMADHWQAGAENYFTRVPKKLLLEELGTAVSAATKRQLEPMKRDAMAKAITTELKGRKWLPPIMTNE